MTEKQILVIEPNGDERRLGQGDLGADGLPSLKTMQEIVGGGIEFVRVLRADIATANIYTYMVANETGLLDGLPENHNATEIYLANVRRAYPDSDAPWDDARRLDRARYQGVTYIDITPELYRDKKPVIVGTVIWFDGYTVEELLEMGL